MISLVDQSPQTPGWSHSSAGRPSTTARTRRCPYIKISGAFMAHFSVTVADRWSPFDVGEFLRDLAVPNHEHVDAADVADFAALGRPGVAPANHAAVGGGEDLLRLEPRLW